MQLKFVSHKQLIHIWLAVRIRSYCLLTLGQHTGKKQMVCSNLVTWKEFNKEPTAQVWAGCRNKKGGSARELQELVSGRLSVTILRFKSEKCELAHNRMRPLTGQDYVAVAMKLVVGKSRARGAIMGGVREINTWPTLPPPS